MRTIGCCGTDWPEAGKVDGSAHIVKDRGFVFLFNPNDSALDASFTLDESIGLADGSAFRLASVYPKEEAREGLRRGAKVAWPVPPRTAVVLELSQQ